MSKAGLSLEARIISKYTDMRESKLIMSDPSTIKELRDRKYYHRLENILLKRYNRPWYEFCPNMNFVKNV